MQKETPYTFGKRYCDPKKMRIRNLLLRGKRNDRFQIRIFLDHESDENLSKIQTQNWKITNLTIHIIR